MARIEHYSYRLMRNNWTATRLLAFNKYLFKKLGRPKPRGRRYGSIKR